MNISEQMAARVRRGEEPIETYSFEQRVYKQRRDWVEYLRQEGIIE